MTTRMSQYLSKMLHWRGNFLYTTESVALSQPTLKTSTSTVSNTLNHLTNRLSFSLLHGQVLTVTFYSHH
ncbi:unnamed protein product [Lactuca virosa]|uniref:Uncharacterized protein n=1 Tax=Lactuca virosa TaxID=75947 RepID=A0AAU9NZN6_9ASTR|nr:unnamed protein product [Lactuca virosa]